MRFIKTVCVLSFMACLPSLAQADEYGERFYNQAPKGLGDFSSAETETPDIAMDDAAQDLQDVMPAAGEEEEQQTSSEAIKPRVKPQQTQE